MVRVAVAGYVALPGDGGHGPLPGNCSGIHCVAGCVSYLEHYIIQLNSKFLMYYIFLHLGYSLYVVCVTV